MKTKHRRRTRWTVWGLAALLAAGLGADAAQAQDKAVLVAGDSMMRMISRVFERELAGRPGLRMIPMVSLGSGLARLDLYDWPAKLAEGLRKERPAAAILLFGTNDSQPMKTTAGVLQPGTADWNAEYTRRAGALMDQLLAAGVPVLYWIGLPDMGDAKLQQESAVIRGLIREACRSRPKVKYVDTIPLFSRTPGEYSGYVYDAKGMPLQVRDVDGVHLSRAGAKRLIDHLMPDLLRDMGLR